MKQSHEQREAYSVDATSIIIIINQQWSDSVAEEAGEADSLLAG
jgi:hypothetical protein